MKHGWRSRGRGSEHVDGILWKQCDVINALCKEVSWKQYLCESAVAAAGVVVTACPMLRKRFTPHAESCVFLMHV